MPLPTVLLRIQDEVARPYRQRIMANIYRSDYAEAIVAVALDRDGWTRMEAWSSWDFEHESGCRLEVKQAAAAQSWGSSQEEKAARFDIKAGAGRRNIYDGTITRRIQARGLWLFPSSVNQTLHLVR